MERPRSILVISEGGTFREGFFRWEQKSRTASKHTVWPCERVRVLLPKKKREQETAAALLSHKALQGRQIYDVIIIADIFETLPVKDVLEILDVLTAIAKKQVLAVIPERCKSTSWGPYTGIQKYHPVFFRHFDFSYLLLGREHENKTQLYSFFGGSAKGGRGEKGGSRKPAAQSAKKTLNLAYILPDQDLTGGMKQLLLQAQAMHKRGHRISLYTKAGTTGNAIPPWSDLTSSDVSGQYVLDATEDYLFHIGSVDAVILGWMEQVPEFCHAEVPLVLWEQGSRLLFGDFGAPQSSTSKEYGAFRSFYRPPVHLLAVSPLVQTIVRARFGRPADLVCAAVNENFAQPQKQENQPKQILLVGDAKKDFKNFAFVIQALVLAAQEGAKFVTRWATPTPPLKDMVPKSLRVQYHVMPPQDELYSLYQSSDLLLSHSLYEAFSLPPLEAMAAGTAVLAVNNGGIETYAVSGENCLLCPQGDLAGYVKGIHTLLSDDALRKNLAEAGIATARRFSVDAMCDSLEDSLYRFTSGKKYGTI